MSFTINLYRYAKPINSTSNPSGAAYTFSDCIMREGCSVLQPVVGINGTGGAAWDPSTLSMAAIPELHRYYRITDFEWAEGLWWLHLDVDALASWRSDIRSFTTYVIRSSYSYDGKFVDRLYPAKMTYTFNRLQPPRMWTCGPLPNYHNESGNAGMYVVGIASTAGIIYYVFSAGQFSQFLSYIFSDAYYSLVLSSLAVTMYPEAKIAVDPMQYIVSCRYIPATFGSGDWAIYPGVSMAQIHIGTVLLPNTIRHTGYIVADNISRNTWTVIIDSADIRHPEADVRGEYLNGSPYSEYELYYPPFGFVQLNADDMANADQMDMVLSVDARVGVCSLDVTVTYDVGESTERKITIAHSEAMCGMEVPLAHVQAAGINPLSIGTNLLHSIGGVVANTAAGNYVGAVAGVLGGASNVIQDAVQGQTPHLSKNGSVGSMAPMYGTPHLMIKHYDMAGWDVQDEGAPLMRRVQLGTIPGYIVCDDKGFRCPATLPEIETIRQAMREGFYLA